VDSGARYETIWRRRELEDLNHRKTERVNRVKVMKNILSIFVPAMLLILVPASSIFSHCDGLDGPVVRAAEKAIASGDVSLVLIWVQKSDEAQIKKSFEENSSGSETKSGSSPTR
jgi:hypothetical protein